MKAVGTEPDLTFEWPPDRGFPVVLFLCVAGSLLAHAATFVLFHVVYPQRVTIPQPSPHLSLLVPSSAENIALLRWIEAEDPALVATANPIMPPLLAEVRYRPSFSNPRTVPLGAPAEKAEEVIFPAAFERLTPYNTTKIAPPEVPPRLHSRTLIDFADPLASRPLVQNPPLIASLRSAAAINPSVLLVGVDRHGEPRYQFLQQSSGDPLFDDLAARHLQSLKFAPAEPEMVWAHVVFTWGGEVYRDAVESTPPRAVAE